MATDTPTTASASEPRALSAALAAPAFTTRTGGLAMHAASRHVERWAPETDAGRGRPLRSLGFVDRLVAPWIETAQRSAGLRMFSQYLGGGANGNGGFAERDGGAVSWVFPRPWYQDELDWMAAARHVTAPIAAGGGEQRRDSQPAMLTTRGTYVPPARASVPASIYEYIAPSLSVARGPMPIAGAEGVSPARDVYSPLVPLAAVQAAQLVSRTMAQLSPSIVPAFQTRAAAPQTMAPALRSVLATLLSRAATNPAAEPMTTRWAASVPEMSTPPAPRPDAPTATPIEDGFTPSIPPQSAPQQAAERMATQLAEQRVRVVELQRAAQQAIAREVATRVEQRAASAPAAAAAVTAQRTLDEQRAQVEVAQQRAIAARAAQAQDTEAQRSTQTEAQRARLEEARVEQAQLQARIDERVAQRIAERAASQPAAIPPQPQQVRLHEQARVDAARDARVAPSAETRPTFAPDARAAASEAAVAALAAAMSGPLAALAPELAAIVGARPERAAQVIGELSEALRAAELMSRATASGHAFEATRGPRLAMPAGLGGLVATVDRAHAAERPAMAPIGMPRAAAASPAMAARRDDVRVPTLSWVTAGGQSVAPIGAPASALGATAAASPTALQHVAWADRWLARFAGATPASLDVLDQASAHGGPATLGIAGLAPGAVFVAPTFDTPAARQAQLAAVASPAAASTSSSTTAAPALMRFDDTDETPDDVFAAISASASSSRGAQVDRARAATAAAAPALTLVPPTAAYVERASYADAIAHAVPAAPNAGMSAQLASSPFAPALRHVLPMPAAPSFDVRALFGGALSATYLAGLLGGASREIASPSALPWSSAAAFSGASDDAPALTSTREAPAWDATYVAPELPAAAAEMFDASGAAVTPAAAPTMETVRYAQAAPALTTLRSALLAWDVEVPTMTVAPAGSSSEMASSGAAGPMSSAATARSMIEAMSMPMLTDSTASAGADASWSAPGMVADRAQSWSVAQERSSADLSFDFVTPELVLAARVYGLGPAEAAQAARLAIAGPGQLSAMAGMVDRTFVQAMAADAQRRDAAPSARAITAYPSSDAIASEPMSAAAAPSARAAAATTASSASSGSPAMSAGTMAEAMSSSAFGVERRAPRGAFLWPSATVAALNLNAASPDGTMSMSVAALELLAAQAVAEIGTYAAFAERPSAAAATMRAEPAAAVPAAADDATEPSRAMPPMSMVAPREQAAIEPSEQDVIAGATALVPSSRRARFEAMYVALGQSHATRSLSPAARAARALALAGRGDDAPTSTRERATEAWDVLPVVYAMGDAAPSKTIETGAAATRAAAATTARSQRAPGATGFVMPDPADGIVVDTRVDTRPGLSSLSARAGEALGSYVSPTTVVAPAPQSSQPRETGAVMRAPTAAQELVRTGRPSGRYGGGEVEIPTWFENAARKMFEDKGNISDGISLAELTLVTSAPQGHIAASTRSAPSAAPAAPSPATGGPITPHFDVDKIAHEVYRQILVLMDNARARNGEPFL